MWQGETCILENYRFGIFYSNALFELEFFLTEKPDEESFTKAIDKHEAQKASSTDQESGKPEQSSGSLLITRLKRASLYTSIQTPDESSKAFGTSI